MASKAEEIAANQPPNRRLVIEAAVNETLEWAAQQCEAAGAAMNADPDNEFDGMDAISILEVVSGRIRAGKSEATR